jgi:hypothetical protein
MVSSSVGETAGLLIAADKESWVEARKEKVHAKGKGELQTYWLQIKAGSANCDASSVATGLDASSNPRYEDVKEETKKGTVGISRFGDAAALMEKMSMLARTKRLVEWNTEILAKLLKQILVRRAAKRMKKQLLGLYTPTVQKEVVDTSFDRVPPVGHPIDAVIDIIFLPHFDAKSFSKHVNPDSIEVPDVVMAQLGAFVGKIADLYQLNAFHNFEVCMFEDYRSNRRPLCLHYFHLHFPKHASHVTMSGELEMTVNSPALVSPSALTLAAQSFHYQ